MLEAVIRSVTHKRQPDWFLVDDETAKKYLMMSFGELKAPKVGISCVAGQWHVHRTHLPLIDPALTSDILGHRPSWWTSREQHFANLGITLRSTQHEGADFIEPRRGSLVADDMRLGKTLTAIAAHDPQRGPLVIVAPLSARGVWLGWLKKSFPDTPIGACVGRKLDRDQLWKPIVFVHYDIVHHWQAVMKIGTLVLDEAHYLVNKNSKRSQGCAVLAAGAEKVVALTGTPIWKLPANLWNVVSMLAPGAWGNYYDFGRVYGAPIETGYGVQFTGISNEDELQSRMTEVMIRRLWKDYQSDLPPISRNVIIAEVDEATRRRLDILAAKLKSERTNTAANLAHYRAQLAGLKQRTVVREAEQALDRGEPVVVWTWHRQTAEDIAQALGDRSLLMHGEISADKREEIMVAWKTSTVPRALVATMAVGQVAIDLSHSHLPIYAELDWTPAIIGQSEMRTYDPKRGMSVTFVVANHWIDLKLIRVLISKLNASSPLKLEAAGEAIRELQEAIDGPTEEPDLGRFFEDLIASDV